MVYYDAAWSFSSSDHLGTPRLTTDVTGAGVARQYWPFGDAVTTQGSLQVLRFAAMEFDAEGGTGTLAADMYYDHARSHVGGLGRFLSPDKLPGSPAVPQSWNRFAYVLNNPIRLIDPTGMYTTNCGGDDKQCSTDATNFERARQESLTRGNASERTAAAAYGDQGADNGVKVRFGDPGDGSDGVTSHGFPTWEGATVRQDETVLIRSGLTGTKLVGAVAHEGSHLLDAQAFISSIHFEGASLVWDFSKNLTSVLSQRFGDKSVGWKSGFDRRF